MVVGVGMFRCRHGQLALGRLFLYVDYDILYPLGNDSYDFKVFMVFQVISKFNVESVQTPIHTSNGVRPGLPGQLPPSTSPPAANFIYKGSFCGRLGIIGLQLSG
jgi:hypothetical protein